MQATEFRWMATFVGFVLLTGVAGPACSLFDDIGGTVGAGGQGGAGGGGGGGGGRADGGAGGSISVGTCIGCDPFPTCLQGYAYNKKTGCNLCECLDSSPCAPSDCGLAPDSPTTTCPDGSTAGILCHRSYDNICYLVNISCPPPCRGKNITDCAEDARCAWIKPACVQPTLDTAGCYDQADLGCTSDAKCGTGRHCVALKVNPCIVGDCPVCSFSLESICM